MAWLDPSDYRTHLVSHLTLFLKTHAPFASAERSSLIPFLVLRNLAPYQAKTRLYKGSASIGSIGGSDPFCVRFESIESFFYPLGIQRISLFIRSPGSSVSLTSFPSPPLRHSETSTAPVHFWVHPPTFQVQSPSLPHKPQSFLLNLLPS